MHCVIRFSQLPQGGRQGPPRCGFADEETEWREVSRLAQSQVAGMCGVKVDSKCLQVLELGGIREFY